MTQDEVNAISTAMSAILTALGVSTGAAPIIVGLVTAARIGPEVYALIKQDIDLFTSGAVTDAQLQERFAAVQDTFERLSQRWKTTPSA